MILNLNLLKNNRILLLLFLIIPILSCNDNEDSDIISPSALFEPQLIMAPNENTPLAGILILETDEPTRVNLTIDDGDQTTKVTFNEFDIVHSLTVLGFLPDTLHSIQIEFVDRSGNKTILDNIIEVATDPLPEDFPEFEVVSNPRKMEPGITLFRTAGFIIAINEIGEVVCYVTCREENRVRLDCVQYRIR